VFDIVVTTVTGIIYCLYLNGMTNDLDLSSSVTNRRAISMIDEHDQLGHLNIDTIREIARGLGLNVEQGGKKISQAFTLTKAEQTNVVQLSQHERNKVPGDKLLIGLSSVKPLNSVIAMPNRHWHIIVDEDTSFKVLHFYQKKDLMA